MKKGFSLTELLVVMALLAIIGGFTIPKVLDAQGTKSHNAKAKAAISMVQSAYNEYQEENAPTASMGMKDLTPYLNYVRVSTLAADEVDSLQTLTNQPCSNSIWVRCVFLGSGGTIVYWTSGTFGNVTSATSAINFYFDPDGKYSGSTTGDGKSVQLFLYAVSGNIIDAGNIPSNTQGNNGSTTTHNPWPTGVPPWFSWN